MCLINVAHEHLIAQTDKKSKPALINFMGPGAEGPRAEGRGSRKTNTPLKTSFKKFNTCSINLLLFFIEIEIIKANENHINISN